MLLVSLRLPALATSTILLLLPFLALSSLISLPLSAPLKELLGKHMLAIFQTDEGAGVLPPVGPEARRKTGHVLSHLDRQAGLTRLEHDRLVVVDQR